MNEKFLLVPGRHHLWTDGMISQIASCHALLESGTRLIVAVTSVDQGGTRANPIAGYRRLSLAETVISTEEALSNTSGEVYGIPLKSDESDVGFYIANEIRLQSNGRVDMTKESTVVLCSNVLGGNFSENMWEISSEKLESTWSILQSIGSGDFTAPEMCSISRNIFSRYDLFNTIQEIYSDDLIGTDDGDIDIHRDYAKYRDALASGAARKFGEIAPLIKPGAILDVGCCDGAFMKLLSENSKFSESDLFGIEVSDTLYRICEGRKIAGDFGDTNVFFSHTNFFNTKGIKNNSMDTVVTMALTHEIWSYGDKDASLEKFSQRVFEILKPGGVWINYDVCGPDGLDEIVEVKFKDGEILETAERFWNDFKFVGMESVWSDGKNVDLVTTKRFLLEFLAHYQYTDSWDAEVRESFCFNDFDDWVGLSERIGFKVDATDSKKISNGWLVENRFIPAISEVNGISGKDFLNGVVTNGMIVSRKP